MSGTAVGARRRRAVLGGFALLFAAMTVGGVVGVIWWWGVGFDEAEALGMATPSTDAAMVTSFWID